MLSIIPTIYETEFDVDSTIPDLPRSKLAKRARQQQAVREALATENTLGGAHVYASCVACQAISHDWRAHLPSSTRSSAYPNAVLLKYPDACAVCGGSTVQLCADVTTK
jgi:hypothetical protein